VDEKDWVLFASIFLWKVIPALLALVSAYFIDPIWFRFIKPTSKRVADRFWDRLYLAYWRRQGFSVSYSARRSRQSAPGPK
jgi:hypothetical protein